MSSQASREEAFWAVAFVACCVLLLAPLWVTDWLPLVDLPQHAAQLAIGQRWSDPAFDYPRYFEFNLLANSIAPYALSYALALIVSIETALRLTLCIALLGIPLVTWRLVLTLGGNRWWTFAAFPIAYGYAFAWGFLSFVLAAPLGLYLILTAIRFRAAPSRRRAFVLVALCYLLFASHVLVLAYAGLAALVVILLGAPSLRQKIYGATALASVMPVVAAWWVATKLSAPDSTPHSVPLVLGYDLARFPSLLTFMVGEESLSVAALLPSLIFISVPFLVGARLARESWRRAPLACTLAFHFLVPLNALDTAFLFPRFTLFLIPTLLIALDPTEPKRRRLRWLPVSICAVWLVLVSGKFYAFGQESRAITQLVDAMEPNKRLLTLVDNPRSRVVPWSPYLHAGCWYQVRHGGIADFSFGEFFPNRFRYRAGMDPPLPFNVEWAPQQFRWNQHGGALYDYFLVRHTEGARWFPFANATSQIELIGRYDDWRLYKQTQR